ncbi:DapH/DapD/GlmU-related protein [Bacteroides sp.]|uniref:acyltransferase n=1 Tax=Bacteroides sp. TaxID=29523 RepID=UPI00261B4C08|nr:acyltransferase [Bacteroides sp.]MDD3038170.1 acyltransferase [Bacteroides sp.]
MNNLSSSPKECEETLISWLYRKIYHKEPPYYCYYSLAIIIGKPIRKWFSAVLIPTIPFNNLRVWCYRRCGYKIGKNTFIGMRCYLDDMCYDFIEIGDNVTISYGVYFACHGRGQGHVKMVIKDGAYIGMRTSVVAHQKLGLIIGEKAIIGANSLVIKSVPDGEIHAGVPAKRIK